MLPVHALDLTERYLDYLFSNTDAERKRQNDYDVLACVFDGDGTVMQRCGHPLKLTQVRECFEESLYRDGVDGSSAFEMVIVEETGESEEFDKTVQLLMMLVDSATRGEGASCAFVLHLRQAASEGGFVKPHIHIVSGADTIAAVRSCIARALSGYVTAA